MISFRAVRENGGLVAFTVKNHGRTDVCAAVSLFVLNTVNSIEALTEEPFRCDHRENGGYIDFELTALPPGGDAKLLLDAMMLGINGLQEQYPSEIEILS